MAEGWKQIWEDFRNTVRGEAADPAEQRPDAVTTEPQPAVAVVNNGVDDEVDDEPADTVTTAPPAIAASPPVVSAAENEAASLVIEPDSGTMVSEPIVAAGVENVLPATADADVLATSAAEVPVSTPPPGWLERLRTVASLLMMIALFGVMLWSVGGNEWWARWQAPKPPAADVVATFDGGQITVGDVEAHLNQLVPEEFQVIARSPQTFLEMVEDLVLDELARRWAATRQPDKEADFGHTMQHISESLNLESLDMQRHENEIQVEESEIQAYYSVNKPQFGERTLEQVREQIRETLVAEREPDYIENYLQGLKDNASIIRNFELLDVPTAAEDDLRRYYDANLDQFRLPRAVKVDELQFPIGGDETAARRRADDGLLKVRSGATFAEAGQPITNTLVLTNTPVAEGMRDPAWDTAVFALTQDELSGVFRAGNAFYVVRLNELQPARTQTLAEVRTPVLAAVQQQKDAEWFGTNASKTLFTLKSKQYSLGQFYKEYQELPLLIQGQFAGPQGMRDLAEQLIERLLLVEDAYDQLLDVQNKPLVDEARLQVLKQMLHQEEVDDKLASSDEELQKYYVENQAQMVLSPKVRIRYVRIGLGATEDEQAVARARADEAYGKLVPGLFQQGADFATVAQEYSEDPETATNGGELPGWVGESPDMREGLEQHSFHGIVLNLPLDMISPPFELGDSLYIVQVIERTEPELLPFEQAKPYIQDLLSQQKHVELEGQLQEKLLKEANFVIYQSVLESYLQQLPTPVPLNLPPGS